MTDNDLNISFGKTPPPESQEEPASEAIIPDHTPEALKIPPETETDAAEPVLSAMSESFLRAQQNFIQIAAITILVLIISITLIVMRNATQHNSAVNLLNFETISTGRYTSTLSENFYNDIPGKSIAKKLDRFFDKLVGFSGLTPPKGSRNNGMTGPIPTVTSSGTTDAAAQTTTTTGKSTKKTTKKSEQENYETLNVETGAAYSGTATSTKEIKTTSTKKFSLTTTKKKAEETTKSTTEDTSKTEDTAETTAETTPPPAETTLPETTTIPPNTTANNAAAE